MQAGDAITIYPDLGNCTFADWLLCLGNNKLETIDEDYIKCPDMMVLPPTDTRAMAMAIYPRLHKGQATNEYLRERAILAPRNKEVSVINTMVLNYLPGAQVDFLSADSAEDTEVANTYPSEFLNTLEVSGMPSRKLPLKIGAPVMLLRNLDPSARLCNGTRLIVRRFTMRVIEVECRNPTLAKCGGEAQHSQSWGLGVLRDSRMFRAREQGPKNLVLGFSWCHWKVLEA
jgi:hypothetical protein